MEIDKQVQQNLERIAKAGFEVAIVGGAVRDILWKKEVSDWDLTTNARPEDILKIFPDGFYNNKFGTVGVPVDGKKGVEITTYRKEYGYSDKRHPDKIVWGKTLEEDLARRDFTINSIALKYSPRRSRSTTPPRWPASTRGVPNGLLGGGSSFEMVDPYDGQSDLKNKLIRAVGDPDQRFREDALRLLRAVRFATTLGFEIDEKTKTAIAKNAKLLSRISGERIRDELFKILVSKNATEGILLAKESRILKEILPEVDVCFEIEQKSPKRHHIFDVGTHCAMSLKYCPSQDIITRLSTLLHDIGKVKVAKVTKEGIRTFYNHEVIGARMARDIANRLHISKQERERLFKLVRWHQFSVNENQTDSALRRFIRNIGVENIENMMDLRVGDRLGGGLQRPESWRLKLFRQRLKEVLKKPFTIKELKVNGRDVMEILKIKPGPKVGEVLNKLFQEVLEDASKNNREYLMGRIKKLKS